MLSNTNYFKNNRGKEFQTDYGELKKVCALLRHGVPVMALTKTATDLLNGKWDNTDSRYVQLQCC